MVRYVLSALCLFSSVTTAAQDAAEPTRYDRALAAGYKALMLCGAIGNSDPAGSRRSVASVEQYELTGIQSPLDSIVPMLTARVESGQDGFLDYVAVEWADDMPPRIAAFRNPGGCSILPIGSETPTAEASTMKRIDDFGRSGGDMREALRPPHPAASSIAEAALGDSYGDGTRTTAVLIQHNAREIAHSYAPGFDGDLPQRTWSVAKSIAATLVGAAVHNDAVDVSDSADLGLAKDDPRRAITIDHLLRMTSGRISDTAGNRTDPVYWGGAAISERAPHWPLLYAPGSTYRYANNDTLMAIRAIEPYLAENSPAQFFATIGMRGTVAETDWQGGYVLSSQVWSTARDFARLGQLYLDDGVTRDGVRVLPEDWIEYVSAPTGPQPEGRAFGYGAGFWLMNDSEGVPSDTFAGFGNRGQYLVIVPSLDLVIVRRGEDPVGSRFDIAGFTRDVIAALQE